jgi:hypothetical protein
MYCPHQDFGVCDNCWARQKADDRHAERLDHDARRRADEQARDRDRQRRRERDRAAAAAAGPSWLDQQAAKISAQGAAKQSAKSAARATQPFNLFWYERVGVVALACVLVLMMLSELPTWLLIAVVVGLVVAWRRGKDRSLLAVVRVAGRFIRGERAQRGSGR